MANNHHHHDPEHTAPLLSHSPENYFPATHRRQPIKILPIIFLSTILLSSIVLLIYNHQTTVKKLPSPAPDAKPPSRILPKKDIPHLSAIKTEASLRAENNVSWQRTAFHFQPASHYICDPDGPLYHMGWYHLFYQYNPVSAVWGNITWAHAVSKDMINWFHLPLAMVPEHWYDIKGVLSGSATVLPSGEVVMLYTGNAYDLTQVQCLAYAANSSDPLLLDWVKYENNPILVPPPGIGLKDFRDPTTAWVGPDGKYVIAIGSKHNTTGITLLYKTTDFKNYELLDWELHGVFGTGMWECVDLYPVSTTGLNGLDMSANGPGIKHVLKESGDEDRHDWYAIGTYDPEKIGWTPDDPTMDVGIGLRYDYGKFYASRSFYDQHKQRRILWGYLGETDTPTADLFKGWAQVLNIPRTVVFDAKTKSNLIQWPIEEVNKLRSDRSHDFEGLELPPGSVIPLNIGSATQLDIMATFEIDREALEATVEADVGFNCTTSDGSKGRAVLGPFGLVVVADKLLSELTPVYFYIAKGIDGSDTTYFCADETRSSLNPTVRKMVVGSKVPVLRDEKLTMRLLVDHSVVESFAQGGRTVITSRVYPTKAIYESAKLFLFNNATGISVKASLKIWHMSPAKLDPFPFDK